MRRVALLLCLFLVASPVTATAAAWYVAPQGDDLAAGSIEQPFATVPRAQRAANPGDTVFLRGGTYRLTESQIARRRGLFSRVMVLDKSGTPGQPITYSAYSDEVPIFDGSAVQPSGQRVTAFYVSGSWLHLRGIEVTGVQVTIPTHTQSICFESQGSHNIFERLSMHDGQAIGIYHVHGSDNLFLNCDAWNNWDHTSENGRGGNVDGFGGHPDSGSTGNVFRGCRAWFNSDDGFDCISAHESVTFENCWAMSNGLSKDGQRLGDGNGFKAGGYGSLPARALPRPIPRHIVRDCLAVGNPSSGFYANHHPGGGDWISNAAFRNGTNFHMLCRLADNSTDVPGYGHKLLNNLSHGSRRDLTAINRSECEFSGNSFSRELKLRDQDFQSLDESELTQPRQSDGSLPAIRFLQRIGGG
jgi:Right handed beta helix region